MVACLNYSKFVTLKNGKRVEIRPPKAEDHLNLITFLRRAPKEQIQFCKEDFQDGQALAHWLGLNDARRSIFLIAVDLENHHPVGSINLTCGRLADHKVGEIQQIVVDFPFQGFGLGSLLLDSLIYLASKTKLNWLKAEVVTDLKALVKAFESRGFKAKTILEDYYVDKLGNTYDVALMMLPLAGNQKNF